jgi:hypothetical protein
VGGNAGFDEAIGIIALLRARGKCHSVARERRAGWVP